MNEESGRTAVPTVCHWGACSAEVENGRVVAMTPDKGDPDPSWLGCGIPAAIDDPVHYPAARGAQVRKGYLDHGPGGDNNGRCCQPFVAVD